MSFPHQYVSVYHPIKPLIANEIDQLEGDDNEIYFYTTIENARALNVGCIHLVNGKQVLIGSIETRLSGHLPKADTKLFFYAPQKELEDAIGLGEYKWGVLVAGEIL